MQSALNLGFSQSLLEISKYIWQVQLMVFFIIKSEILFDSKTIKDLINRDQMKKICALKVKLKLKKIWNMFFKFIKILYFWQCLFLGTDKTTIQIALELLFIKVS